MTILEKVAQAIYEADYFEAQAPFDLWEGHTVEATAAITAFLAASAKAGWHMRPDEATRTMAIQAEKTGADEAGDWADDAYGVMLAAAPEFEWKEE